MTVHRSTLIECDGCGESYPSDTFAPGTATDHRRDLRREGWRTGLPGGRDLCGECAQSVDEVTA